MCCYGWLEQGVFSCQGYFLFCFVCAFVLHDLLGFFFLPVQGKFIDCNSVSTSIKPKHWEDLPYTSAPLRLSSEAAVVVKL